MSVTSIVQRYRVSCGILYKHKDVQAGQPLERKDDKSQALGRVQSANKAPQNRRPPAKKGSQQPSKKKQKQ